MGTSRKRLLRWPLCVIGTLVTGGCASSASSRHEDVLAENEAAAQQSPSDERAYREAAEKLLKYLDAQRRAGTNVIQASGKDGIYPMYECMEYGCPDRVFCKEVDAYCPVTHCGKGSCRGCPEPAPDVFKNLALKQWCKFDCLRSSVRAGTALGFVPIVGKDFFIGPFCLSE
jgi:hypothetical protein